ncbi:iron complex transport system permease protein [Poseidonocella pacifica]|uniref:Iron complex transport system permease protein n=1 Tax=Poseidonocella pacifica TaxID=871651 RepID=A0A1I0YLT4_9RHOB|nr:iron ABC transporter permease [Poseidonocella pacifica]SFB13420.1 iron complex transport system permease protein [Poseidonocella pacifica]
MTPLAASRLTLTGIGLLVLLVVATGHGSSAMPPLRVIAALLGEGTRMDEVIVWTLRLPRICLAVLCGMALALAGALLQRVTRNPMAAPSILGVTDGAAFGVVAFLWVFSDAGNSLTVSIHWQPMAAALGAFAFAGIVAVMVRLDPAGKGPLRMILYGVALAALAKAMVTLMMILGPVYRASQALTWITGSVGAAHWSDVMILAAGLLLCVPVLWLMRHDLRQLSLDPESAFSSGLSTGRSQAAFLALSVLLTALAVSQVGAVGFIGLIAPHAARLLHGQFTPGYLASTALIGGALLLGADTLARTVAPPLELPAGALTALVGAPLFLWLLMKGRAVHA